MTTIRKLEISQDELTFFLGVAMMVAGAILCVVL